MRVVEVHSKVERDLRAASVARKVGSVHGQRGAIKSMPGICAGQGILKFVVHRWIVVVCVSLVFDHFRSKAVFRESRFGDTGDAGSSPAEQAARANEHIGHAACYRMRGRIEADESKSC
jgi:hypothetical protein